METPQLQLAILGDIERADLEEGGVTLQWLSEYLGIAKGDFEQPRVLKDDFAQGAFL